VARKTSNARGKRAQAKAKGYEERLTEEQLRVRLKQIFHWSNKVGNTKYDKNATPEQKGGMEQLSHYFLLLQLISDHVLRLKIAERKAKMSEEEKKEEILQSRRGSYEREVNYHVLIKSPEELLTEIDECREEIAQEYALYEDLLTAFHVEANSPLRPINMSAKPHAPRKFTSEWKRIIKQAIIACPEGSLAPTVANWIYDNCPDAKLPSYCDGHEPPDLGWLVINNTDVGEAFRKDFSRVKSEMKAMLLEGTQKRP
jgi:hypothetical protein